ncbi:MAG: ABC transporter ATP-binding protein [Candidatus Buchananbacteria bacterium]|nr:ABC transporter ATP-binding protein [Candidatus Buchananbacteria bacterium]
MQTNTKKTLKIYWRYSLKYKIAVFSVLIFGIASAALTSIVPLYFKHFFDVLAGGQLPSAAGKILVGILLTILGLELFQWFCTRAYTFFANYFESKVMIELSNHAFAYLLKHSFGFFNDNFVGSLVKKVKWFSRSFEVIADRIIWSLTPLIVNIVVIVIVLFSRNLILGGVVLFWVIVFLIFNWLFIRYKLKYDIARSEAETETTGVLADAVTNNSTIKFFNGYDREVDNFANVNENLRRLRKLTWDLGSLFDLVQSLFMVALEIGSFYLAIKLWQRGILTVGDFVLIQSYLLTIFHRTWDFGRVVRDIYESLADAEEMTEILNTPHEIQDVKNATNLVVGNALVEFKKVTFCYHQTRKVLDGFDLTIKPKEHIALIGPSGAGKTTVTKLLMRIYDLTGGEILIDGQDIAKVTQESLWQNISLVPQDPVLFHRSLMENIRYGKPEATDEQVIEAAKLAHCHEFISTSPDGYQTYVGERGIKLSGGERQRVAIARAILRNAPILILDEATSSLDSESEKLIQDALDKLMAGKTVIVVAHRLSTIRKMDRIVVVDNGQIIEQGSHDQLLKNKNGLYCKLWQLQSGGFLVD